MIIKNFGGKEERGIKFNMLSLEKFEEKIPFTVRPENTKLIYATFWAGLCGYTTAKEQEQDYTYEDVQDWVDKLMLENRQDEIEAVCNAWAESDEFKYRIKQIDDWTEKVRSLVTEEDAKPPKKKVKSISNGLPSTKLPLASSA